MVSTKRFVATGVLLVVGLASIQAFGAVVDLQTTYDATRVDPSTDAAQIADGDPDVIDLDEWIASVPTAGVEAIRTAVDDGTYEESVPPELYIRLDDHGNETTVAVYDGRYYRMNATLDGQTTDTRLEFVPIDPATAAETVATPYDATGELTRRAVEEGSVSTSELPGETGLVQRAGTYYLVTPRLEGAVVGKFLATIGGFVLRPAGYAYTVSALVLLSALRVGRSPRPLDERLVLGVTAAVVLVLWTATTLGGSGSIALRYVAFPVMGAVAALGILAGLYVRRRAWRCLGVLTVATPVVGVGSIVATLGTPGLLFGPLALVVGWVGSLPLVAYGYVYGSGRRAMGGRTATQVADDLQ